MSHIVLLWATTLHTIQGSTVDNVISLRRQILADGEAYINLSSVTTLEGITDGGLDSTRLSHML